MIRVQRLCCCLGHKDNAVVTSRPFDKAEFTKSKGNNEGYSSVSSGLGVEKFLHNLDKPPTSLGYCLVNVFRKYHDHILQVNVETGEILTYNDVLDEAFALASGLRVHGVTNKGLVFLVACPNDPKVNVILLASILLGATLEPIDPCNKFCDNKLQNLSIKTPHVWFCVDERINYVRSYTKSIRGTQIISLGPGESRYLDENVKSYASLVTKQDFDEPEELCSEDVIMTIPVEPNFQNIVLKNGTLLKYSARKKHNLEDIGEGLLLDYEDWAGGGEAWTSRRIFLFRSGGSSLTALPSFEPERILFLVQTYRVSWLALKSTQFLELVKCSAIVGYDLTSLRVLNVPPGKSALYSSNAHLNSIRERLPSTHILVTGNTVSSAGP